MGSPSGLALTVATPAARKPATAASVPAFLKNSRLEIAAICILNLMNRSRIGSGSGGILSQFATQRQRWHDAAIPPLDTWNPAPGKDLSGLVGTWTGSSIHLVGRSAADF